MECSVCNVGIMVSDLPVACSGACARVFHYKCTPLNKATAKLITENVHVLFKCNDCLSEQFCCEQSKLISDIKRMEEEVKKLSSLSDSLKDVRDSVTAQIDSAVKNGMDELALKVNGFEKLICEKFKIMTSSFFEINAKSQLAATNNLGNDTRAVHSESGQNHPNSKKRKIQNSDTDTNDDVFVEKPSFADVLKSSGNNVKGKTPSSSLRLNSKLKNRKTRPVIVIKPKESNQACEDTRKFVKSQLDPRTHKINNFRNGKNGSIIVECVTGANVVDVKNGIESGLGGNYSAVVPTSVPRLKVVGMSDQYSSDVFIDYLKSQNEDIAIKEVKVLNMYENPRFNYNKFGVVIEVDIDTYNCLLSAKKVNIGFDRCSVVPAINVLRCFKCGEFGHISNDCKNGDRCSKCSLQHKTSECTSTVLKCINCMKMNNERKMNLDTNHATFSNECLVYKKLFEQKKSSLRFNK